MKYYVFWTTINLFFSNQLACWLYIAGADAIFAWIIAVSYVPALMTGAEAEINMFKSSYTGAILSRSKVRKKLQAGILGGCIFFGIVSFGILWALPVFTILLPYAQRGDLPVGVQIDLYLHLWKPTCFYCSDAEYAFCRNRTLASKRSDCAYQERHKGNVHNIKR